MSFNGIETHEEWEARDAIERKEIEFPLEESLKLNSGELFSSQQPIETGY
jgi:hypothetical protein